MASQEFLPCLTSNGPAFFFFPKKQLLLPVLRVFCPAGILYVVGAAERGQSCGRGQFFSSAVACSIHSFLSWMQSCFVM